MAGSLEFSFLSTMYNNVNRVKNCLDSILSAAVGLDFEIIVVDNFSTDGSYEIVKDYAQAYKNIRLFRCRCTRGVGFQIAFEKSNGEYVVPIGMDSKYFSEYLQRFLTLYKKSKISNYAIRTWGSFCVYPRHLVEKVGGWNKFNVGEDMDIYTRLFVVNGILFMPISLELNEEVENRKEIRLSKYFIKYHPRENRYADGLKLYLRLVRNQVDFLSSDAYTTRKVITIHRYQNRKLHQKFFFSFQLIASKILNAFLGSKMTNADEDLLNMEYVIYQSIKNIVNPEEFGFKIEPISSEYLKNVIDYITYVKPDVAEKTKLVL